MGKTDIEKLLEKTIGLKVGSIGQTSIKRAIHERMKKIGLQDVGAYMDRLKKRPAEIHELIEDVVIPETWFFRDHFPFVAMVNHLVKNWDRKFELRILSLPCSSGEEPYSIAMALLQAGIEKDLFRIDAVDISKRSLERAKIGEYTNNSFRSKDLRFRDIFFVRHGKKYVIKEEARQNVRFIQGNIINSYFVDSLGIYDIIFSRNILIYFDELTQQRTISNIERILKPGGVIFTGHAEAVLFVNPVFKMLDYKKAFGIIKKNDPDTWQVTPGRQHISGLSEKKTSEWEIKPSEKKKRNIIVTKDTTLFERAQKLADQGELSSAEILCNKLLDENGSSSALFFLMGVIKESQGQVDGAIDLLRKALYLDPQHYESLVFLSLLAKRTGDEAGARNYRRRANKIDNSESRS